MAEGKKAGKPPRQYRAFVERYPHLGAAWEECRAAEAEGPIDEKAARLVKLGVAIGCMREGAVHSAVRKARSAGATETEIRQVVALAASTIGLPSTVAVDTWVSDSL